ncbi:MAG: glycosyltransferase [Deltaproteobacteria bacterium]
MKKDVSILIVHFNTPRLLRQTLKGIFLMKTQVSFEVIVIDNNPLMRVSEMIQKEFSEVKWIRSEKHLGFGGGMNLAMQHAVGRYLFVFNPDIILLDHVLDTLTVYMDGENDVGLVAPRLSNPDHSLQYSCYTFMKPEIVLYRRLPFFSKHPFAKKAIDTYLMKDWDHADVRDVDYVLGAAMFVRRKAYEDVGGFDPKFFVYF